MVRFWKYISARALAADLTDAGYPVSEDVVQRWKRNRQVDPRAADRVAELLGLDTTKEAPRPEWAKGLPDDVAEAVVTRLAAPDSPLVDRLEDRLEALGLLPSEGQPEESTEPQGGAGTSQPPSVTRAWKR